MSPWDDDDWVGTPPEGRHTRDQAKPEHWARQTQFQAVVGGIFLFMLVILILALVL